MSRNKLHAQLEAKAVDYVPASDQMAAVDNVTALMSIAISLKRIADRVDQFYDNGFTMMEK